MDMLKGETDCVDGGLVKEDRISRMIWEFMGTDWDANREVKFTLI